MHGKSVMVHAHAQTYMCMYVQQANGRGGECKYVMQVQGWNVLDAAWGLLEMVPGV